MFAGFEDRPACVPLDLNSEDGTVPIVKFHDKLDGPN